MAFMQSQLTKDVHNCQHNFILIIKMFSDKKLQLYLQQIVKMHFVSLSSCNDLINLCINILILARCSVNSQQLFLEKAYGQDLCM